MHYKTGFVAVFALCCFASLAAGKVVGSGKMASETRPVAGESGVELASIGHLIITQGEKEELVIEAEDNIVPLVSSEVDGKGLLLIHFKEHDIRPTKDVTFRLTVRHLDRIALSGSGNIDADKLEADHVQIRLPGSGDITVAHVRSGELAVSLEGSGNIKLAGGTAHHQTVSLAGSGSYNGSGLQCADATVQISGSGDAKVHADDALAVNISGSGEVAYSGNPKLTKQISGSGEVSRM